MRASAQTGLIAPPRMEIESMLTKVARSGALLIGLGLLLGGCPKPTGPTTIAPLPDAPRYKLRSFSETAPFTALARYRGMVYAATHQGLIRFGKDGTHSTLGKREGLADDHVFSVAAHPVSGVFAATRGGVSHYAGTSFRTVSYSGKIKPPITKIAATPDGVWVGGTRGVQFLDTKHGDKWTHYLPGVKVRYLLADYSSNDLIMGTDGEGLYRFKAGSFKPLSRAEGQPLRSVRAIARSADGGLFAVGNLKGKDGPAEDDRLIYFDGRHVTIFNTKPGRRLHWVMKVRGKLLLAHGRRVFTLVRGDKTLYGPKKLPVGPLVLEASRSSVAPSRYPVPYFYTREVKTYFPDERTAIVGHADSLLIGTKTRGALVFDGKTASWFRTASLFGPLTKLSIGCVGTACYHASTTGRAYRFDGKAFTRVSVDSGAHTRVLAMTQRGAEVVAVFEPNAPTGAPAASDADAKIAVSHEVKLARLNGKSFQPFLSLKLSVPAGTQPVVRFARYDPRGNLWLGLAHKRGDDVRPWGVTVVSRTGATLFHRTSLLPSEDRGDGSLALPDDIRDVFFDSGKVWLATGSGVCEVDAKGHVTMHTENQGMASEICYALTKHSGHLLVATYSGVGRQDGKFWRHDFGGLTGRSTRAIVAENGVVFVGTDAGLFRFDGNKRTRITSRDGLAGDVIVDLQIHGRHLWVLTKQGVSIIERPVIPN